MQVVDYFYKQFHSHKIENESIAKMLLDASYNHEPKTFKKFMESGIKEVEKNRDDKVSKKSIKDWAGKVDYLNACDNEELKVFYDKFAKERLAFMKDGRVDKFVGIITRAEGYVGNFKVDKDLQQAISVEHAEKIVGNKYGISEKVFAFFGKGKISDISLKDLIFLSVITILNGYVSEGIDNAAHIGVLIAGLFTGLLCAYICSKKQNSGT